MQEERYKVETSFDLKTFEFTSEGSKGKIEKVVVYSEINLKEVYNLADRKSTRLNSSHITPSRMPSSA